MIGGPPLPVEATPLASGVEWGPVAVEDEEQEDRETRIPKHTPMTASFLAIRGSSLNGSGRCGRGADFITAERLRAPFVPFSPLDAFKLTAACVLAASPP
jgi:hypothetical protein